MKLFSMLIVLFSLVLTTVHADEFDYKIEDDSPLHSFTTRILVQYGGFLRSFKYCTGVLIREDLVFTAAHCLSGVPFKARHPFAGPPYGGTPFVIIGTPENAEVISVKRFETINMPEKLMNLDALKNHPLEVISSLHKDLMLLHLSEPSRNKPVKILTSNMLNGDIDFTHSLSPGFPTRRSELKETPNVNYPIPTNIANSRACSPVFDVNTSDVFLTTNCYITSGNSGGPLLIKNEGEYYVYGINSISNHTKEEDDRYKKSFHINLMNREIQNWINFVLDRNP